MSPFMSPRQQLAGNYSLIHCNWSHLPAEFVHFFLHAMLSTLIFLVLLNGNAWIAKIRRNHVHLHMYKKVNICTYAIVLRPPCFAETEEPDYTETLILTNERDLPLELEDK